MLYIDKDNNITLTRGDALTLTVGMKKGNQTYTPQEGDTIRFAISKRYLGEVGYTLMLEKAIPTDTLQLSLTSEETKLANGVYNYDVEITHGDGKPDTFISARFTITGECK